MCAECCKVNGLTRLSFEEEAVKYVRNQDFTFKQKNKLLWFIEKISRPGSVSKELPLILSGFVVQIGSPQIEERTVVRHDPDGLLYYWHNAMLYSFHTSHVLRIWNHDGLLIWNKYD